jgi:hypothetical protein
MNDQEEEEVHHLLHHHELSTSLDSTTGKRRTGQAQTPAMAAGLTDHVWSVFGLLSYQIAPFPWVEPKRRGRPCTRPLPDPTAPNDRTDVRARRLYAPPPVS